MKNYKNHISNILLSAISILLGLLLFEISTRFYLYLKNQKSFEEAMSKPALLKPNVEAPFADIITPSKYPGIIYEMRPNIKTNFMHVEIETNNQGWRDKAYPPEKPENTIRIIMLGDSHMFGWGVGEDKRYSTVLENKLNKSFPEKRWEIINTAVPGYNTYMEVETLERKALIYHPDIVIMEYVGNDLDLPNFIMASTDYLNFKKSFFADFLKGQLGLLKTKLNLIQPPTVSVSGVVGFIGEHDLNLVPEKYKHMVGWESFLGSMLKLKKMQQRFNFEVMICISHDWPPNYYQKIIDLCKQLKFHVLVNLQKHVPGLILSQADPHPSALGHEAIANSFLSFMEQEKIINKYIGE